MQLLEKHVVSRMGKRSHNVMKNILVFFSMSVSTFIADKSRPSTKKIQILLSLVYTQMKVFLEMYVAVEA